MPNKTIVAIGSITAILIIALLKGIDGVLLGSGLTILGALGGYAIAKVKKQ